MIIDRNLVLTTDQAITSSVVLTDTVRLGRTGLELGVGEPLALLYTVDVAADATTGDETYQFELRTATNANGTTGAATLVSTTPIGGASLPAGRRVVLMIPRERIPATATHITGFVTTAGTTPSITVSASIIPLSMVQGDVYYASGFTVQP